MSYDTNYMCYTYTIFIPLGHMEAMIHRRLRIDDSRGVGEPLDETDEGIDPYPSYTRKGKGIVVKGRTQLLLSPVEIGVRETRVRMDEFYHPLSLYLSSDYNSYNAHRNRHLVDKLHTITSVSTAHLTTNTTTLPSHHVHTSSTSSTPPEYPPAYASDLLYKPFPSPLLRSLPKHIQLITFERWSDTQYLLRLAHAFAINEDIVYSTPITIDIYKLFLPIWSVYTPISIVEMSLSVNQPKAEMLANKIKWRVREEGKEEGGHNYGNDSESDADSSNGRSNESSSGDKSSGGESVTNSKVVLRNTVETKDEEKNVKDEDSWLITLKPMEIKTYLITVK